MDYATFDYPRNENHRKKWKILSLIIALSGFPLIIVYQRLIPIFVSVSMALLIYFGLWYARDYTVPLKIGVGDHGVDLFYVNGKRKSITWAKLNSYGLSSSPETTVAPAIIFYFGRKFNYVSYSAAVEIAKRYELLMNKPLREVWLAKDLKNRFRNL